MTEPEEQQEQNPDTENPTPASGEPELPAESAPPDGEAAPDEPQSETGVEPASTDEASPVAAELPSEPEPEPAEPQIPIEEATAFAVVGSVMTRREPDVACEDWISYEPGGTYPRDAFPPHVPLAELVASGHLRPVREG